MGDDIDPDDIVNNSNPALFHSLGDSSAEAV
eukprot:CAMPEP_0205799202 /NCGR_PEP_ID=MMETSP0205-20121125/390_1 /ASSEMBLY_ACC=CAM_ASM_000278 /TAXON_ID=36767 /ORGANISM="Euplotes focardii, Strain TN1" /LENGTH=30 /DNA_ID= /DNA_START= /DNA_END= /DNA_ORIENTATION=